MTEPEKETVIRYAESLGWRWDLFSAPDQSESHGRLTRVPVADPLSQRRIFIDCATVQYQEEFHCLVPPGYEEGYYGPLPELPNSALRL